MVYAADFGLSKEGVSDAAEGAKSFCGTPECKKARTHTATHTHARTYSYLSRLVTNPTACPSSDDLLCLCAVTDLAPEVVERIGHGTAVDWWSLGMLLYEMLTGLPPWYTKDRKKLYESLKSAPLEFPNYVSARAQSLIAVCFAFLAMGVM